MKEIIRVVFIFMIILILADRSGNYINKKENEAYQNQVYKNTVIEILENKGGTKWNLLIKKQKK